ALASSAKSTRIAWAGYVPGLLFGIAQVAVLYLVLTFALDFSAGAWVWTLLFSILVAACFHAVHQLCVAALGGVGRLIALVLLMIQIASAGGTYPVQTAPGIFQVISPFLPMTHAVNGLRTLIAGGDMFIAAQSAVVLLLMLLISLVAAVIVCSRKRMVTLTQLHPSLQLSARCENRRRGGTSAPGRCLPRLGLLRHCLQRGGRVRIPSRRFRIRTRPVLAVPSAATASGAGASARPHQRPGRTGDLVCPRAGLS